MPRSARINSIKSLRCYTIGEAAGASAVTDRTIRAWITDGLPVMSGARPHLIRGDDLRAFIQGRRTARKSKSAPHVFHCFKCKAPRQAAGGFAECHASDHSLNLKALCEVCECVMNKRFAKARLEELKGKLDLLVMTLADGTNHSGDEPEIGATTSTQR